MVKKTIPHFIAALLGMLVLYVFLTWKDTKPAPPKIEKVGTITTSNGVVVEIVRITGNDLDCTVAVQMILNESGRAFTVMECQ